MTVGELLERLSAREFAEWGAFYALEAEDRQQAELAAQATQGLEARRGWGRR